MGPTSSQNPSRASLLPELPASGYFSGRHSRSSSTGKKVSRSPSRSPYRSPSPSPFGNLLSDEPPTFDDLSLGTGTTSPPSSENAKSFEPSFLRRWSNNWVAARRKSEDPEEGVHGELGLHSLYISPEPLIDVVFVHGLKGGSVKTWRKGTDPRYFWPQYWLPLEPGFERASIHSFGYDSNWGTAKESDLNVHDFGTALFEELRTSQFLRSRGPSSPIILIGHSMGGLVIKKAVILARRDAADVQLAKRIRSIIFLATPHRGSNLGSILKNILAVSRIPKQFVADISSKSISAQLINEDFVQYADGLSILSFFETLPMSLGGMTSIMVVDKDSAVIGIRGERSSLINANHRDICKFDGQDDPNFIKVRDAISTEIETILHDVVLVKQEETRAQLATLHSFLGLQHQPEDIYDKVQGTCNWIENREDFCDWRDPPNGDDPASPQPTVYWVSANPGTGKTVLAGHVISHLQQCKLACAYYYFHFGKKASQNLSGFLRSTAYQMAQTSAAVREVLLQLHHDGSTFNFDDARAIWITLYRGGILQARISNPQYWVIDALDECLKYSELFTMLKNDRPHFPLRIFITSRRVPEIQRISQQFGPALTSTEIPVNDTLGDIGRYVANRLDDLPIDAEEEKQMLSRTILAKSGASFLWVRLVLDELQGVWTYESILEILDGIPVGMVPYYKRTVERMAENPREKHIAKAILLWTVVAARPLHRDELAYALELDIQKSFPNIVSAVEGLCGQLVAIDKVTGLVHIVHTTAREFLLSEDAGEFRIEKSAAHERLALICLQLLQARALTPPRNRRVVRASANTQQLRLLGYAVDHFSDHIFGSSSAATKLLTELDRFFKSNVLTWIDYMCRTGDIDGLIRSAKNFSAFLDRRAKYASPFNQQSQMVENWSVTLARLATKFGAALLRSPSSIYFLIPPMCPTNSMLYKTFGRTPDGISLTCYKNEDWGDCIATVTFEDEAPSVFTCGDVHITVGFRGSGCIRLFHHRNMQQEIIIQTGSPVDMLHVTPGKHIVSSSPKFLCVWAAGSGGSTELLWKARIRARCITLASSFTEIVGIMENGRSCTWELATGNLLEQHKFPYQTMEPTPDGELVVNRAPGFSALSPNMEILALGYRHGPVCLWDFQQKEFIGWAEDEDDGVVNHLLFNPNPEIGLLLVAYSAASMALYDSWSGASLCTRRPDKDTNYAAVTCSPDGRTLATVDVSGCLRIWEFESLIPLYQVQTPSAPFRMLGFTSDSGSVVDIAGSDMRIWSPASLVRKMIDEDASTSDVDLESTSAIATGRFEGLSSSRITQVAVHPTGGVVFAATNDGQVSSWEVQSGKKTEIYVHPLQAYITQLAVSSSSTRNMLASSDVNCCVQVSKLDMGLRNPRQDQLKGNPLFSFEVDQPILQLLFDLTGEYLLVSMTEEDRLYSVSSHECLGSINHGVVVGQENSADAKRKVWKWFTVPLSLQNIGGSPKDDMAKNSHPQFGLVADGVLDFFSVADFAPQHQDARQTLNKGIDLGYKIEDGFVEREVDWIILHEPTGLLFLDIRLRSVSSRITTKSTLFIFQRHNETKICKDESSASTVVTTSWLPVGKSLRDRSSHFLGICPIPPPPPTTAAAAAGQTSSTGKNVSMAFLHANSWICSVGLASLVSGFDESKSKEYTQHFFAPSEFLSYSHEVPPVLTPSGDIVFCMRGEIAVVRNGLKFEEVKTLEERASSGGGVEGGKSGSGEDLLLLPLLRTNSGFQTIK